MYGAKVYLLYRAAVLYEYLKRITGEFRKIKTYLNMSVYMYIIFGILHLLNILRFSTWFLIATFIVVLFVNIIYDYRRGDHFKWRKAKIYRMRK